MVRLSFALTLLAAPALADCYDLGIPHIVHFDHGGDARILSSTARDITFSSPTPDRSPVVTTLRYGLYPMTRADHGVTFRYEWQSDLPDPRKLALGPSLVLDADLSVEHATRLHFQIEIKVLRDDILTLNACPYKVRLIALTDRLNGQITEQMTQWFAPDLMFSLRTDRLIPPPAMTLGAIGLE